MSARPLVFAHDLDEPFLERLAPRRGARRARRRARRASARARAARLARDGERAMSHDARVARSVALAVPKRARPSSRRRVEPRSDAQLDLERARRRVRERQLVRPRGPASRTRRGRRSPRPRRAGASSGTRSCRASRSSSMMSRTSSAAERVEARRRLVEEHELGLVEQRLREARALQHALAVGLAAAGAPRRERRRARAARRCAASSRRAAQPEQPAVEAQQLAAGEPVVKAKVLGQEADPRAGGARAERRAEHGAVARRSAR